MVDDSPTTPDQGRNRGGTPNADADGSSADESSGVGPLDKLNEAVKSVLGPADRGTDAERADQGGAAYEDRTNVAEEHGDRLTEDSDGNPIAIAEESPDTEGRARPESD